MVEGSENSFSEPLITMIKVFKTKVDPLAIDLISKMLVYLPEDRITPIEALIHPYFNDLRNQSTKINGNPLPDLFNFTEGKYSI